MKRLLEIIIFLICCVSCSVKQNSKMEPKIAAIVNDDTIFLADIDSVIDGLIYEVRSGVLNQTINSILIEKQAQKENITLEILRSRMNFEKDDSLTNLWIGNFLDSLKEEAAIRILLQPNYFKMISTTELLCNIVQAGFEDVINVFIVSDYKCPHCRLAKKQLHEVIGKNKNVSFHFIYHSDYIDSVALFAHACGLQGKFFECYNWLFEGDNAFLVKNDLLQFAFELGLDMAQLEQDMSDDQLLKDYVVNKEKLYRAGITRVPCFIVNGKLLIHGNPMDYLQNVIDHEKQN